MDAKHTPGPWEFDNEWVFSTNPEAGKGDLVCLSPAQDGWEASQKRWADNAPLLAAAPDLLDALIELCSCPSSIDEATIPAAGIETAPEQVVAVVSVSVARLRKARAAIAKARGEQP